MVHGRRRQLGGTHAGSDPIGHLPAFGNRAQALHRLGLARFALRGAKAQRDDAHQLLTRLDLRRTLLLAERERHPAAVESQALRQKHQALAVVAHAFLQVVCRLSHQRQVVAHAGKTAVLRHHAAERARLVATQLHVQVALVVALGKDGIQRGAHVLRKWLIGCL